MDSIAILALLGIGFWLIVTVLNTNEYSETTKAWMTVGIGTLMFTAAYLIKPEVF